MATTADGTRWKLQPPSTGNLLLLQKTILGFVGVEVAPKHQAATTSLLLTTSRCTHMLPPPQRIQPTWSCLRIRLVLGAWACYSAQAVASTLQAL